MEREAPVQKHIHRVMRIWRESQNPTLTPAQRAVLKKTGEALTEAHGAILTAAQLMAIAEAENALTKK